MMKKTIIFLFNLFIALSVFSKEQKYSVNDIDPKLTENAKVVVRDYTTIFEVESAGDGKMKVTYAITIMNEAGLWYSYFAQVYNKFIKIRNIKGTFYDKNGNQIKKLKKEDLLDIPAISGFSLYEDNRAVLYDPEIKDFPFTVEYSYSVDYDGFINYPDWSLYTDYNVSLENKSLTIIVPEDMEIRRYRQNFDYEHSKNIEDRKVKYSWAVDNLPALTEEPYSPELQNSSEVLFLAPQEFKVLGSKGSMDTWTRFGDWIYELNSDRDKLPDETVSKIKELVKEAKTDFEKVKILYKYMQNKTRYVNISVGLGGWQPFEAEVVDKLSYGDCKALSNYMYSLLKAAGIRSIYTLVRAGSDAPYILSDFPMNQFNHAILCVPLEKDTIWLECTNHRIPAGYTGEFTDDRDVLLIEKEGSKLAHTKIYSVDENRKDRMAVIDLKSDGSASANILTKYIGLRTDDVYHIVDATDKDKKDHFYKKIQIPDFILKDYNYHVTEEIIPIINEEINLDIKNYGTIMGNRIIVPVNLMNKVENVPRKVKNRKNIVYIRRSNIETDSLTYQIPEGYVVENLPQNELIQSAFGTYQTNVKQEGSTIYYKRTLALNKGKYPKESYNELRSFYLEVSKADFSKFVLVKSE